MMRLELDFRGELADDWVAVDSIAVIKCMDAEGNMALCIRSTPGITPWEALGMCSAGADMSKAVLREMFQEGDSE